MKRRKQMKSEDHIHFLSELLQQINELLAMVQEYCDEMVGDDDEEQYRIERHNHRTPPF